MPSFWQRRQPPGSLEQAILRKPRQQTTIRIKVSGTLGPLPKPADSGACTLSHGDSRHSSQARCFCGPAGAGRAFPGAMAGTSTAQRNASRVQGAYEVQGRSTTPAQWEILRLGADRQGLGRGGEENRRPLTCRGSKSLREGYAKLPVGAHETKGSIRNKQQRQGIGAARTAWQHTLAQQRISHRGFSMQVGETSEAARRPDPRVKAGMGPTAE